MLKALAVAPTTPGANEGRGFGRKFGSPKYLEGAGGASLALQQALCRIATANNSSIFCVWKSNVS